MAEKIRKLLVVNRGEIAVRIIKTCRRMGISTVAVYSDADSNSIAVSMADEVVSLGDPIAANSYLNIPKLLDAIRQTGADAVHPGYGFLSEKEHFAKTIEDEGIFWVGPNSQAIGAMGDKINSKMLATAAGVNVIPGCGDVIVDVPHAIKIANQVGYPVMLKASAGGGGKGIRVAYNDADVEFMFPNVTNEGQKNFGDGRIFIEKYIKDPRHIEIQVIADKHGNVVCLGERECSIQRNHQKVIEEAPSAFMTPEVREEMYKQVKKLCKLVGYDSAGTVEFVMDNERHFYFLEMNTRLQVEHTVTEFITGLDLVELMIQCAEGHALPFSQEDVKLNGHSIQARICSEDPTKNFLPSVGWLNTYIEPKKSDTVRVDSGVMEGYTISSYYDSMIAKVIVYGASRAEAIDKMMSALSEFVIDGVENNILFVESIMRTQKYRVNDVSVNFIKQEYPEGFKSLRPSDEYLKEFVVAAFCLRRKNLKPLENLPQRLNPVYFPKDVAVVMVDNEAKNVDEKFTRFNLELKHSEGNEVHIHHQGELYKAKVLYHSQRLFSLMINDKYYTFRIAYEGPRLSLSRYGFVFNCLVFANSTANAFEFCQNNTPGIAKLSELEAPISGIITAIHVKEGDMMQANTPILTIEAMKMENLISVEFDTRIKSINCKIGDTVSLGDLLIDLDNDNVIIEGK